MKCDEKFETRILSKDNLVKKQIEKLTIKCPYKGCNWKNSGALFRDHYEDHIIKKCKFCLDYYNCNHYEEKSKIPKMLRDNDIISESKFKTKENLDRHLKENIVMHIILVYVFLMGFLKEQKSLFNEKLALKNRLKNIENSTTVEIKENFDENKKSLKNKKSSNDDSFDENDKAKKIKSKDENRIKLIETQINKKFEPLEIKLRNLDNKNYEIKSKLASIQDENDKLVKESKRFDEEYNKLTSVTVDLKRSCKLNQVKLFTLDERLLNLEKISYNGTLLWKINNVQLKMEEAKNGKQTSFYSPPFYTDKYGYKMCARIYLNGDGNGRNTHLSLFFVILRGEYDALLKWPFRQKVTFILIDQSQSESKENVYDAFRPDPNSSSFRRPISEMNIASGLPVFCPLGKLMSTDHEYIKDNTMFIKIIVDTKDLNSEIS